MNIALRPATLEVLNAFRQRRQKLLKLRAALALGTVALLALLVIALLDRAWFMPESIRPWFSLAAYAGAAFAGWKVAWRFISEARETSGAARLLEIVVPAMRERMLSAVELAEGHGSESEEFRARLQDDVAAEVQKISLCSVLPLRSLKSWIMGFGLMLALIIALSFVSMLHLPGFFARAAIPFANLARPSSVEIVIAAPTPADTLVPFASEMEVIADIIGPKPDRVQIETQAGDAKSRLTDMRLSTGSRYQSVVAIGQIDLRYRIVAADAISSWFTLSARARPRVIKFVKTVVPPAYSGLPEIKVTDDQGDIEALEGSIVKLTLKLNQPISKASLLINPDHADHPEALPAQIATDDGVSAALEVKADVESWQMALTAKETGFTNDESSPWSVISIPDLPPVVQIIEPIDQIELLADEAVRLSGLAGDDVGLERVLLAHSINAAKWSEKEVSGKTGKEAQIQTLLGLAPMQVKAGDTVMIKLIAIDLKGQRTETQPLRVIILEQTVSPEQRQWAAQTRRFAQQAETLAEDVKGLRKNIEQVSKIEKAQSKNPEAERDAKDARALAQGGLEKVTAKADDLWKALQETARTAPTHLDVLETQLLGERLAHMRSDALKEMQKAITGDLEKTEPLKRDASEAQADADTIASAARAFAAEDNARLVAQQAQQLSRQEALLTDQSLSANRDATQRPKWQEQQRASMASSEILRQQIETLKSLIDGGQQNTLKEHQKQIGVARADLEASLDKPDQAKSPEHLYGASDNLRQRLARAADAARGIAESAAAKSNQLRELIARQENPAVVALQEAKAALNQATAEAKDPKKREREDRDGLKAPEKAVKELASAAKQLEEQAALREQNTMSNDQAALDTNRASRAADKLAREVAETKTPETAAQVQAKAEQLSNAVRALEVDALAQTAMKAIEEAAFDSDPTKSPTPTRPAEQARAAAEALKQLPEALRRMSKPDQQMATIAQQAADQTRNAAEQLQNLARQAATQPANQPLNQEPAKQATEQARQKVNEVAQQIAAQGEAARVSLAELTPQVSDMMKAVAQDLKKTLEQTKSAAKEAEAAKPVAEVAEKAATLQTEAAENAEKMSSLQAALRQEANAADLQKDKQRQMARTADGALAQMQQKAPQIAQNLQQAQQAQQSQPQAKNLNQAAQAQQQTAQALDQLAQNMAKAEQGQELSEQEIATAEKMEQEIGAKEPLDEAYDRAQKLAQMAQDATQDPGKVLAELEKELPKNPSMQKALAEISKQTAQSSEQAVTAEAQQPSNIGLAADKAANDLARVSRHQQRLGQEEAAQQTAEASNQLQQQAQSAKGQPGQPQKPVGNEAQAAAAQAAKSAEATAAATPPAMLANPFAQVQSALLAQALDQLDATLHPQQGSQQPQQGQQDQQQQQQGKQGQQSAQQSLSQAQQSQQQQMADQRNQGQTPGSQQPGQQMAQNQKPGQNQSQAPSQNEGGNLQATLKDGVLGAEMILVNGDWGHLPSKMAEDLSEATRSEAAAEYRAAIESYYKAIATKARK